MSQIFQILEVFIMSGSRDIKISLLISAFSDSKWAKKFPYENTYFPFKSENTEFVNQSLTIHRKFQKKIHLNPITGS